jgi:protein TonB
VFSEFQVERPVRIKHAVPPMYPPELRAVGMEGEVVVQFVVDTMGRAEMRTFRVLRSTHSAFDQAVRDALPLMRFEPARLGGRLVRQVVQEPFTFALAHE